MKAYEPERPSVKKQQSVRAVQPKKEEEEPSAQEAIFCLYQEIIANQSQEIEQLKKERDEAQAELKKTKSLFQKLKDKFQLLTMVMNEDEE